MSRNMYYNQIEEAIFIGCRKISAEVLTLVMGGSLDFECVVTNNGTLAKNVKGSSIIQIGLSQ